MKFRFIGQYTNGHESITTHGVTFHGHEPSEAGSGADVERLKRNVEFEEVADAPAKAEKPPAESEETVEAPAEAPKPRRRRTRRKRA